MSEPETPFDALATKQLVERLQFHAARLPEDWLALIDATADKTSIGSRKRTYRSWQLPAPRMLSMARKRLRDCMGGL